MSEQHLRVGDAERDRASASLGEHYSAGRLTDVEYAERLDAIWTARTRSDLDDVFHDLPRIVQLPVSSGRRRWLGWPYSVLLVLVVGGLLITRLPWFVLLIAGVVLFKIARRQNRGRRSGVGEIARWVGVVESVTLWDLCEPSRRARRRSSTSARRLALRRKRS